MVGVVTGNEGVCVISGSITKVGAKLEYVVDSLVNEPPSIPITDFIMKNSYVIYPRHSDIIIYYL